MKRFLCFLAFALLCALPARAQVSPLGGTAFAQFFDNNGKTLTNGVVYFYQGGTTTQQATFTDYTGSVPNPNPLPLGVGGRLTAWLTTSALYKIVVCLQNDGPACASGDILAIADQVPGGNSSSSSGSTSPFISASANPATTGILRLASADTICWRNNGNSGNLCLSKDANDVLTWPASVKLLEISSPVSAANYDLLYADSSAHRFKMINNGGATVQVVGSGVDINASDQVNQLHFGTSALPLNSTPPSPGKFLFWDGSNISGFPIVFPTTGAAHSVPVVTTANAAVTYKVVPNCAGSLTYNQSTDAFGCSTAQISTASKTPGCTTAAPPGSVCADTLTWSTPFADAAYFAVCSGTNVPQGVPVVNAVQSQTTTTVAVVTTNINQGNVSGQFAKINCIGVHP
jgi:hypothetical protein